MKSGTSFLPCSNVDVVKVVFHAVVVISEVVHLITMSRCSRCCMAYIYLYVALHPLGQTLSNVHCLVHYEVDATILATMPYDRNTVQYMLLSKHVRRAAYLLPYLYV